MHAATIAAKLMTDSTGQTTGLAVSIEIATNGDDDGAEGIRAAFAEGFRLLRQAIEEQIGPIAVEAPAPPAPPSDAPPPTEAPAPAQPATPAEAEQRFFARYGATIGGAGWADVQRYLGSRAPKPRTVADWIAVAQSVRDHSRAA
ncbi:MAG: hypothetical protein IPO81_00210 [Kouleothrix sp.]|nr:hypothetical protein [Kouleothrix sp.]